MAVNFQGRDLPNGTVLLMGISYPGDIPDADATRGMTQPKVYTYALLKTGALWYVTGAGRVPQAAGWGAVERWLGKDDRNVEWVKAVTGTRTIWPVFPDPASEALLLPQEDPDLEHGEG